MFYDKNHSLNIRQELDIRAIYLNYFIIFAEDELDFKNYIIYLLLCDIS